MERIDLNTRELEKLEMTLLVLNNALRMIENYQDPKENLKEAISGYEKQIKTLQEIIKEPLDILKEREISDDLKTMFLKCILRSKLSESEKKNVEEQIKDWGFLTKMDFDSYFKYYNYLSFLTWKQDRKLDMVFWKQVASENAKINNQPYEVANQTIKEMEKHFENPSNYTKIKRH